MPTIRVALSSIKPNPDNPRIIKDDKFRKLVASIRSFPEMLELRPIVVNADNVVLGGNMRLKACQAAGLTEVPIILASGLTDEQQREFIIKDNVGFGEWDWDTLANEWDADLLDQWGLDVPGFENEERGLTDPDEVPEPPADPITKLGDLITLGRHRLLCGDSTDAVAVQRLLDGIIPACLVFDPPWDADCAKTLPATTAASTLVFTDGRRVGDAIGVFGQPTWIFIWDCVSSWYTPNRPLQRAKLCLWYGDISTYDFNGSHYGDSGNVREVSNSRGSYTFTPDPRGKHLSDVFSRAITQEHSSGDGATHPHSKPIDWLSMLIANTSNGPIVDLFGGSGSTLIAAERTERVAYAMEIDPNYCDVIVKRWEDFTGEKAVRENSEGTTSNG